MQTAGYGGATVTTAAAKVTLPGDCEGAGLAAALSGEAAVSSDLLSILSAISRAVVDIGTQLRAGSNGFSTGQVGTQNTFGDDQLEVDVTTDKAVFDRLKASGVCAVASSEETPEEVDLGGSLYGVAFDPLDGSSIVDANFAVGSIFGVWEGKTLLNRTGREQKAAIMAQYGPRISMAVAIAGRSGGMELTYFENGGWKLTKELKIASEGKVFAPGNLRASAENPKYNELVQYWISNAYTLRYTGGMVPDVYHILFKGKGVFTNVSSPKTKTKLRLLYECAPIALIVEACGGKSLLDPAFGGENPTPISVLDVVIDDLDKRIGVCYGSATEVDRFEKVMYPTAAAKVTLPGDYEGAGLAAALSGEAAVSSDLLKILSGISRAVVDIGTQLRAGSNGFSTGQVGTQNTFGDDQLEVDVTTDKAVFERLKASGVCAVASSEETPEEVDLGGSLYGVAFDPLDGSSIVDANFAVGSIFGVWEGNTLLNRTGREQKAAIMAQYGPRISMAVAIAGRSGGMELTYFENDGWKLTKELKIASEGKVFAPGNLRASAENPKYNELVQYWISNAYTLRYTGGMVPDVYHILFKGKGVFSNVSSPKTKTKLRLLYECAPIALIVEACGGKSLLDPAFGGENPTPISVLDVVIDDLDKRIGVCYGSATEVDRFEKVMYKC